MLVFGQQRFGSMESLCNPGCSSKAWLILALWKTSQGTVVQLPETLPLSHSFSVSTRNGRDALWTKWEMCKGTNWKSGYHAIHGQPTISQLDSFHMLLLLSYYTISGHVNSFNRNESGLFCNSMGKGVLTPSQLNSRVMGEWHLIFHKWTLWLTHPWALILSGYNVRKVISQVFAQYC